MRSREFVWGTELRWQSFKTKTKTKQKTDRKSEKIKARGSENLVPKEIFILDTSGGFVNL